MFNHVMVGTNDLDRAKEFYKKVLGVLGYEGEPIHNVAPSGYSRLLFIHDGGMFGVTQPINGEAAVPANGGTIAFKCNSAEQVKEFHDVAVAAGGTSCEDPPGLRTGSLGPMQLSYVRDPDGNKLCAIKMPA